MAGKLGNLIVSIGANTRGLSRGIKKAGGMVRGFSKSVNSTLGRGARAAAGAAGTAVKGAALGVGAGLGLGAVGGASGLAQRAVGAAAKYSPAFQNQQVKLNYTLERMQMILADKIGPLLAQVLEYLNDFLSWLIGDSKKELPVMSGELIFQDWMTRRSP
tara:strand:+ start:5118 stop:5597 length:480 start_codon:yes stop_codon:yes gene_type:complete